MSKAGRRSKYDSLMTPQQAEEYASELLTDAQIAMKLGIHISTFMEWQKKHVEFSAAIKRGKAAANEKLVKAMHKTAEGYYVEEEDTVVQLDRNKEPKGYTRTVKKRYIPPSTTTQIFLAKNRMPEDYRDVHRQEVDVRGKLQVSTLAELMMEEYQSDGEGYASEGGKE